MASAMEPDDAELKAVGGGAAGDGEDPIGHDNSCILGWRCYSTLRHTDENDEYTKCWPDYVCDESWHNPRERTETDIDLVAADKQSASILLGECKWRNSFDETDAIRQLEYRSELVRGYKSRTYCLFSKEAPSKATQEKAKQRDDLWLVTSDEMFGA